MIPAQDHLPAGGLGNLIALLLQGQALRHGNSAFIDESWNAYPNQWAKLMETPRISREVIEEKLKEWRPESKFHDELKNTKDDKGERLEPWKKDIFFF